jgi:hypothetical protein
MTEERDILKKAAMCFAKKDARTLTRAIVRRLAALPEAINFIVDIRGLSIE